MRTSSTKGFITGQIAVLIAIAALLLVTSLIWQRNIRAATDRHTFAREVEREEQRLKSVITALVRQNFLADEPRIYANLTLASINPLLTADPRFPNSVAGGPTTPGLSLTAIDPPGTPGLFSATPVFATVSGSSPLDALRQTTFTSPFAYTMSKRTSPAADATLLRTTGGTVNLRLREVPLTQFGLVTFETCLADAGLTFNGTSLVLGPCDPANAATFAFRVSPWTIPDAQIGLSERVWEQPDLVAALFLRPAEITDPSSSGPQQQNLARKGQAVYFDGQNISSDGPLPSAITATVSSIGNVRRVVVNVGGLPQTNVLIDTGGPNVAENRISAYHVYCTTPLARDRGVVIVGTAAERQGDVITTNGAVILDGQHTGGPLVVGSENGGVLVNNVSGNATWNAYLCLPAPAPFMTATSNSSATNGARVFALADASVALTPLEQAYDSLGLLISPTSSSAVFSAGFGSAALPSKRILWLEGDATTMRVGVATTSGTAYSAPVSRATGTIALTYSRSQNAVRVFHSGGTSFYSVGAISSERPRVETTLCAWSGSLASLDIITSAGGTVLGATNTGVIQLRGLMALGTVSRFGAATFRFDPSTAPDGIERVIPRIVILDR